MRERVHHGTYERKGKQGRDQGWTVLLKEMQVESGKEAGRSRAKQVMPCSYWEMRDMWNAVYFETSEGAMRKVL